MTPAGGPARLAFATLLLLAAACTGSTGSAGTASRSERPSASPSKAGSPAPAPDPVAATSLVWTQGGLPPGFGRQVAGLPDVTHAVTVVGGTVWLTRSRSASGEVVDHPPPGMAIP
ncbi:MAG: hypothetical protein ACXVQJ_08585, partial [Actinomycetota bacterium]